MAYDMADPFYVIYNTVTKQYLGDAAFGAYENAMRFSSAADAEWFLDTTNTAVRIVGPCIEGETP